MIKYKFPHKERITGCIDCPLFESEFSEWCRLKPRLGTQLKRNAKPWWCPLIEVSTETEPQKYLSEIPIEEIARYLVSSGNLSVVLSNCDCTAIDQALRDTGIID
jgi:hypothetical protein